MLKLSSYLFLSIPILLITGPFLSDLALSLIAILFLIEVFKNKKFELFHNKFFYLFFSFYVYLILNSLLQNQNIDSLKISLSYFRFGVFSLAVVYIINNDNQILKKLYYIFLITFSVLILDGFIQFFYGKNILGYPLSVGPRVSSLFNDELILGSYLSRLFPIFFALLIFLNKKINRVQYTFNYLIFIFAEVLVYLSGERAAFFYMNFAAVFTLLAVKDFKKLRIGILLSSLTLIFIISFTFPNTKQRVVNQTFDQMGLFSDKENMIFSHQHHDLYKTAINITKDNLYFGVGVKNFRNKCSLDKYKISVFSCSTHPHNTYIQLLVELGLVGLIIGLTLLIFISVYILKHFQSLISGKYYFTDFQVCLISAILISLWPFAPTGNVFNNWLNIVYYFPVGILLWSLEQKPKFDLKDLTKDQ
tara:strand:- start:87 stop:1343 length:1257 start_codon:yes stop_codon:yes gene_type:complete